MNTQITPNIKATNVSIWNKNGDHPNDYKSDQQGFENGELRTFTGQERKEKQWEGEVVRYYRQPFISGEQTCAHCGNTLHVHGWIDKTDKVVCPGDYILEFPDDNYYPIKPALFDKLK